MGKNNYNAETHPLLLIEIKIVGLSSNNSKLINGSLYCNSWVVYKSRLEEDSLSCVEFKPTPSPLPT